MSKIDKLIADYADYIFSSGGETGTDYKTFENKYRNILKEIANNIDAKLISFSKNHYTFSAFMERNGNFAYISISDVRNCSNSWRYDILIRRAEHAKDFKGGWNTFTTINTLENSLDQILD